jgi:pimeloyl-ACP methyl ester carboxylesterase
MYFIQKTLKQQYKREGNTTQMHSIRYILLQIMGIDPAWSSSAFGIVVTQWIDIKQNKEYSRVKLPMPVLALGGKCSFGTAALDSMRLLATNVSGGVVPDSGHWIPEERPSFLTEQLFAFFGGNSANTIK